MNTSAVNTKSLGPLLAQQQHLACASSGFLLVLSFAENTAFNATHAALGPINNISLSSDANELESEALWVICFWSVKG